MGQYQILVQYQYQYFLKFVFQNQYQYQNSSEGLFNRVVGIDQLYRNPPSKSSNGQPNQGLLQTNLDLEAVTTSSFEMKPLDCPQPYPKVSK